MQRPFLGTVQYPSSKARRFSNQLTKSGPSSGGTEVERSTESLRPGRKGTQGGYNGKKTASDEVSRPDTHSCKRTVTLVNGRDRETTEIGERKDRRVGKEERNPLVFTVYSRTTDSVEVSTHVYEVRPFLE